MREEEDVDASEHSGGGNDIKDCLAEPLYALLSEVFDLRGVFRWLRRTLVSMVQLSQGGSISR